MYVKGHEYVCEGSQLFILLSSKISLSGQVMNRNSNHSSIGLNKFKVICVDFEKICDNVAMSRYG